MVGGEIQRSSLTHDTGYSEKAQCTGNKSSYLEPNSGSLQKIVEDRSRIAGFLSQYMLENAVRTYLKRIRKTMQKPIEGVDDVSFSALNKGGVSNREQQNTANSTKAQKTAHRTPQQHAATKKTQITKRHPSRSKKVNISRKFMDSEVRTCLSPKSQEKEMNIKSSCTLSAPAYGAK